MIDECIQPMASVSAFFGEKSFLDGLQARLEVHDNVQKKIKADTVKPKVWWDTDLTS
jgi:uncharacterized membrane protein YebE (DUF533 family)